MTESNQEQFDAGSRDSRTAEDSPDPVVEEPRAAELSDGKAVGALNGSNPTNTTDLHADSQSSQSWLPVQAELRWDMADLGVFVLFALGSMVLVGLAVLGGFKLLNEALGWQLTLESPGVQTPVAVLVQIVWELLWLGFIYQIVVVKCGLNFWQGVRWERRPVSTGAFLLFGFALSIAIQLLSQILPKRDNLPIEQMFDTPASAYLLAVFGICVAPFMEELVFRGFIFPVLERRWGVGLAVLITGGTFAAIHAPQLGGGGPELLAMLVVGLILSVVRARTGSLKPSFLVHLGYNSSLFILLFISTNRFQTLTR